MSVRNAILGLLQNKARHGYELHSAFEAMIGGKQNWEVKPAQIYTTLGRLQSGGLISKEGTEKAGGPEKLIYAITSAGSTELRKWLNAPVISRHQRDEFFLKLMIALAAQEFDPYRLIYDQRVHYYRELHAATVRREEANPDLELAHILLLERTIMHMEADLHWLDMIESRLDEIKRQPIPEPVVRPRGRPPTDKRTRTNRDQ
ncbi:MAG: PadR family transcriptional regulator [Proteobacteria bacterium]|nr:PadR family transcriptional regulator [Pseudomonadota bacterium]